MKITKSQLKQIIKEEIENVLKEEEIPPLVADAMDLIEDHFEVVTEMAKKNGIQKEHLIAAVTRLIEIDYGSPESRDAGGALDPDDDADDAAELRSGLDLDGFEIRKISKGYLIVDKESGVAVLGPFQSEDDARHEVASIERNPDYRP